jgi:D-alanyl-D-alanine carboxypeptidase
LRYHLEVKKLRRKVSQGLIVAIALIGALVVGVLFSAVDSVSPPSFSHSLATVQSVSAQSWLVFDMETLESLYAHDAQAQLPIASLTKLATANAVYHQKNLWSTTSITWSDINTEGEAGKLKYGEVYSRHTLLFPLLLESSNDAAVALSRSDTQLLNKMNQYAKDKSLTTTSFADSSGLSSQNKSSAIDLAVMTQDIFKNSRHLIDITSLESYLSPTTGWLNNNPMIKEDGYIGGKNGYTPEAGKTLIAIFAEELPSGNQRTIGYILLNSKNTKYDMDLLRNHVREHVRYE